MANKYVTANNKLVVVDGKLLQVSGDNVDDELLNLIDTQTTSLGTTELSVSELDTLIDNHIVDGVTLDNSALLIDSPSNNSVEIKDIRVSNIDVAFITVNTTNGYIELYGSGNDVTLYQDTTLTYESGNITTDNLVAENIKKDVNILGVVGTHEGGASLNVAYGTTPPADTSKIWLQCEEPTSVEVQNYLGECAVSNVANYGGIENPVSGTTYFLDGYFNTCYIGNNQIAIVGYNHVRIYDLSNKNYIADYTLSMGVNTGTSQSYNYSNILFKDNVLYFALLNCLYSFDLATQTTTLLQNVGSSSNPYYIKYIFFSSSNDIDCLYYYSGNYSSYHKRYNLISSDFTSVASISSNYLRRIEYGKAIKVNNTVYNFYMYTTTSTNYYTWKYSTSSNTFIIFTSFYDFMTNLGWTEYYNSSVIYDGERYIYLIGGYGTYNGTSYSKSDLIIKYDTINDSFELLDKKLFDKGKMRHFSILADNRIYMFGGNTWTENDSTKGRPNQIDYFDLKYDLPQNNVLITTNTINTDNNLPLINTDKLKLNSNIASAYKGNANNLAEKVNAYYWDGSKWVAINRTDYFEWFTIPNQATQVHNNIALDLTKYYITDKEPTLSVSVAGGGISATINDAKILSITINEAVSTTTIIVTATVNGTDYQTSFSVDAIATLSDDEVVE